MNSFTLLRSLVMCGVVFCYGQRAAHAMQLSDYDLTEFADDLRSLYATCEPILNGILVTDMGIFSKIEESDRQALVEKLQNFNKYYSNINYVEYVVEAYDAGDISLKELIFYAGIDNDEARVLSLLTAKSKDEDAHYVRIVPEGENIETTNSPIMKLSKLDISDCTFKKIQAACQQVVEQATGRKIALSLYKNRELLYALGLSLIVGGGTHLLRYANC